MIKNRRKVTQRELQSLESGLKIDNTIQVIYPQNKNIFNIVFLLVISFLGLFGTITSFITLFTIPVNMGSILIYGFIFFVLFSVISLLPDKAMLSMIPILFFFVYLIRDYIEELSLGFQIIVNCVAYSVETAGVWSKYYDIPEDIVLSDYATIFLLFCMFLIACLICIFTIKLQSCILGFAITFPFIECGLYFGLVPDYVSFFMVVCYWIALLSMALSGYKKNNFNKSAGFVRIGNSFYAKSNSNFHISEKIGVYSIVLCMICALLSGMFVTISNYERSSKIDNIRSTIKDSIEDFSLENTPYIISRLGSLLTSGNNGTFNGTLGQKDNIEYDNIEKLSITTDAIPQNDIYLKGYIGSKYTGQSWDTLSSNIYKNSLFDDFKQNTFYPQDLLYHSVDSSQFDTYNITITPIKKNLRTTFIPYFSRILNDYSYINDTLLQSQNRESYSFEVINVPYDRIYNNTTFNAYSSYALYVNGNDNHFNNDEYLQFVNENYLQLDNNQSMENVKNIFSNYIGRYNLDFDTFNQTSSIYNKLEYIKEFLCYNYDYTLSPGKTPVGEDYVEYFLTQMDEGFCSHFASAGTVLCRMLGIPSRYAEGYYISKDKFVNNNNEYTVSVEDNMAHAWTEIYINGAGWINYDFTPGFNNNPTKADLMNAPNTPDDIQNEQQSQEVTQPVQTVTTEVENQDFEVTTNPPPNGDGMPEITTVNASNEDIPNDDTQKTISKTIKNIIIFILLIALLICGVIFRRKYIVNTRNSKISSDDTRLSVLTSYNYAITLLNFIGITRKENTQHLDFAHDVANQIKYGKKFPKVMEIVLKLDLSNDTLSENEKLYVDKFTKDLSSTIYERQNRLGKFIMKYIMCLI